MTDVQQAVPVAGEDNLASGSKAFAVDAKIEYPAFTSWWARTIPAVPVPNSASHHFDAWMASARHRLPEPARKADRLGGDQEAIAREVLAQNLGPRLAAHVRKGGHGYITVANALDAIRAAFPDPTHTREGEEALAAFGAAMFQRIWDSFTDDGWEIEINDLVTVESVKAGLVSVAPFDPAVHSDQSGAAEPGDDFYEVTPAGRAALNARGGA
jgi:hypothetical protein